MYKYLSVLVVLAGFLLGCQNEEKSELITTPDGHQYQLHEALGGEVAKPGDYITFHYQQRIGDSVLYSTRLQGGDQPVRIQIPMAEIPGRPSSPVEEVLKVIGLGDSATVLLRIDTLPNVPAWMQGNEHMKFDVFLESIQTKEAYKAEVDAKKAEVLTVAEETLKAYNEGTLGDRLQKTESGLEYVIHEEGTGAQPMPQQVVTVEYYGTFKDGSEFDTSIGKDRPFAFPIGVGQVVAGWDEGIALLKEGGKATLFVPAELGYGDQDRGSIPANSDLVFWVELKDIR